MTNHVASRRVGPVLALWLMQLGLACGPRSGEDTSDAASVLDDKALPTQGTRYEAEAHTSASGCEQRANQTGFTGSGFVDFGGNGTWMEWNNVSAAVPGDYELLFRYANGAPNPRSTVISVNGRPVGTTPFGSTGGWTSWKTVGLTVALREGKNTIRVQANTSMGGPNLDHLVVTPKDLCPNDANKIEPGLCGCGVAENACGGSGGQSIYEAEQRSAASDCTQQSTHSGFTGSGFMDFGGNGSWIEWNAVKASSAGTYRLALRYTNGGSAARSATLTVNGQTAGQLRFAPTGGWSSWKTESLTATLKQGNNTIRVRADSAAGGPNVDSLTVTGAGNGVGGTPDECPTDPNKTAPGLCGCNVPEGACSAGAIRLPIEVMGPSGTRVGVSFTLDEPVAAITHLLVTCHACGYQDHALDSNPAKIKAAVQVNGGPQVALKHYRQDASGKVVGNASLMLLAPDDADYGGIGGGFRTNSMVVPVTGLRQGLNTLSFTHVNADQTSIGFRILGFNLLRGPSPDKPVLPSARFTQDDPARWSAEDAVGSTDAATVLSAVRDGKTLWYRRDSLYDPALDAVDGVSGGKRPVDGRIRASCSDCHAQDGRDLAYFNYSNHSIIERAFFHGVPRADGRKIAAYIRSLELPVAALARPWNPPYQPGPGLDARPAYEWAAGAGLEAVLDTDADMKPYLFPKGTSDQAVKAVVNRFGTLNMRELPVALQLPDWNQWLPAVHPIDGFDATKAAINQDENGNAVSAPFYDVLYDAAKVNATARNLGDLVTRLEKWFTRGGTCYTQSVTTGPGWRATNSLVAQAVALGAGVPAGIDSTRCQQVRFDRTLTKPLELAKRGLMAWTSVKLWEIQHTNDLETRAATLTQPVCAGAVCVDASEPRGWVTTDRYSMSLNVFTRAPHYVGYDSQRFQSQTEIVGLYESSSWYHLQMILNSGYRRTAPSHFPYTMSHIEFLRRRSGVPQSYRFWAGVIKMRQTQTNGRYGVESGLDLRTAQPFVYYSDLSGKTAMRTGVGTQLWKQLTEAVLIDLVEDASNATQAQWDAAKGLSAVQDSTSRDFSACSECFAPSGGPMPFPDHMLQGRNTARVIPQLRAMGVSESVIGRVLDWCQRMWPYGPWTQLRAG